MSSEVSSVKYENMELASMPTPVFMRQKSMQEIKADRIYNANMASFCGAGTTAATITTGTCAAAGGSLTVGVASFFGSFICCLPMFCGLYRSGDIKEYCCKE